MTLDWFPPLLEMMVANKSQEKIFRKLAQPSRKTVISFQSLPPVVTSGVEFFYHRGSSSMRSLCISMMKNP